MKKILSIMLCAILVVAMGLVSVGCTPEEPVVNDLSLLSEKWKDDNKESTDATNANAGKPVFTFSGSNETDSKFNPVKVKNVSEYCAMSINLADKDLKDFKKLTWTVKGPAETNVIIKLEANPDIENPYKEVSFKLKETEQTFEYDLSFDNYGPVRAGLTELLIFFGAGDAAFEGDVYFSSFKFSKDAPVPANVLNEQNKVITLPYDGVSDTYSIMKGWRENDADTYDIVEENGKLKVTVHPLATTDYKFAKTTAKGNLKGFTKFVAVVKGQKGTKMLLKFEGGGTDIKEQWIDFTGEEQTVEIALTAENLPQVSSSVLFFASPQQNLATGYDIIISKLEFVK